MKTAAFQHDFRVFGQQGAAGVEMGRNILQSDAPQAMISAVHAVVHKNLKPDERFEMFKALKS